MGINATVQETEETKVDDVDYLHSKTNIDEIR